MSEGDEIEIPPIGAEILSGLGDQFPEQALFDFITLIVRYHSFIPQKSDREKIATLVALVLRYPKGDIAFEVALQLKISPDPVPAVKIAMDEIVRQGLTSSPNVQGAKYMVSRLLDGKDEVRKATLEALRGWPAEPPFRKVIEYVTPQLDPHELVPLGLGERK